jgi:NAD(P)-dependent dehydrogenase (short-subunit alcohol dehydrogenase family)
MVDNEEANAKTLAKIPSGRWGKPEDFKGVTLMLASHASDYITGAHIYIDGGNHIM